ncbi:unnamed protein product [Allacma fusca]|uniref:ACB domain-containing protein n=1 Tax=Allacma fusca TaxID=39272 RepID=A0A8J2LIT9_9HEXA|nr:unnamed protein product [Allacma fusca]
MDFVGKVKWDAWTAAGDISQEEAQKQYIAVVEGLLKESGSAGADSAPKSVAGPGLTIEVKDGVRTIKLNRPEKRNAMTAEMYDAIGKSLTEANTDSATNVVVLTGSGEYFCSGNDVSNFTIVKDIKSTADAACERLRACITSCINCQKPLIILVNGPAIGIGVTILGLADIVYASEGAHFTTPFSSLGLTPEACSTYTFPRIMGYTKANEVLLLNAKITARQAEATGLVSEVFPDKTFAAETAKRVQAMAQLPVKSLVYTKDLIRGRERKLLHEINVSECDRVNERCQSEDSMNAIAKYFSREK